MIEVEGISQLAVLEQSGERCLLFFYAKWQEDSLNADLRDQMSAMSVKYPQVKFLSLEAENFLQLTEKFRVSVVPTFIGTHGNVTVGRVEGANPSELLQLVKQLSAVQIQSGATTNASPSQVESVSDIIATLRKLINTGSF
jgi:Thioredoxin